MIDLQLHTNDSDGTWGWKQVLERCLDLRLTAFAIIDHDTIVRRNDILAWAKANEAMAIPGVELSTTENGQTVHLLGYFLDGPLEKLEGRLAYLCEGRRVRKKKLLTGFSLWGYRSMKKMYIALRGGPQSVDLISRDYLSKKEWSKHSKRLLTAI